MFCVFSSETMQFTHFYDMDRFLLRWTFHDQNDTIMFHIRVKTTGWVGFGFADNAPSAMRDYDVIVGGFDNGQGYLNVSLIPTNLIGLYEDRKHGAWITSGFLLGPYLKT